MTIEQSYSQAFYNGNQSQLVQNSVSYQTFVHDVRNGNDLIQKIDKTYHENFMEQKCKIDNMRKVDQPPSYSEIEPCVIIPDPLQQKLDQSCSARLDPA